MNTCTCTYKRQGFNFHLVWFCMEIVVETRCKFNCRLFRSDAWRLFFDSASHVHRALVVLVADLGWRVRDSRNSVRRFSLASDSSRSSKLATKSSFCCAAPSSATPVRFRRLLNCSLQAQCNCTINHVPSRFVLKIQCTGTFTGYIALSLTLVPFLKARLLVASHSPPNDLRLLQICWSPTSRRRSRR